MSQWTVANPIPKDQRHRPLRAADTMYHPEQWPIKKGQRAVMTQDWEYTHDIYSESKSAGKEGTEFVVDLYVPAEASDSGFAFYWGINVQAGGGLLCPAEYCKEMK